MDSAFIVYVASNLAVWIVLIAETLHFLWPGVGQRAWILLSGLGVSTTALVNDVSVLSRLGLVGVLASVLYVRSPCGACRG